MERMYDNLLMLSGGKDSTYMAYLLSMRYKRTLAFTNDVGFMSDEAKENIERCANQLGMDHMYVKSNMEEHKKIIDDFFKDEKQGLSDVCGKCSVETLKQAYKIAMQLRIPYIVGGFNKYSANAPKAKKIMLRGGIIYTSPYFDWYRWDRIVSFLDMRGFITDPTQTNCKYLRQIICKHIERFGENPYDAEFSKLKMDGQIDEEEIQYFKAWCQCNRLQEVKDVAHITV
jgi:tRNA(Ile)-lysidine synthase TilS/MesJ